MKTFLTELATKDFIQGLSIGLSLGMIAGCMFGIILK
jgi:hypothetical protein